MPDSNTQTPFYGLAARVPPSNIQAEQGILGAIMVNAKNYHVLSEFLIPEHFSDAKHQQIFREQARRISEGGVGDAIAISSAFASDPNMVGGNSYLVSLTSAYPGPGIALPYALAVKEAWQRRQLIGVAEDICNGAFDDSDVVDEIVARSVAQIEGAFGAEQDRRAMSLDDAIGAAWDAMEAASKGEGKVGLSTGMPSVDDRIGGLEDGTLNVLAGRPGMGKSAIGWQWAINAARQGIGTLAVSLEMSAIELGRRALSAASGVPVMAIKRGKITSWQASEVIKARKELIGLPLTIEDGGGLTAAQIDLAARRAHRKHGLGLLMVDHLHIVRPEDADARNGGTWAIGRISGAFKRAAKRHRCPVLLLAQLNRALEARDDKRPGLPDLRQAGEIEQDADTVSFVYRPEYYLGNQPELAPNEHDEKYRTRVDQWEQRKRDLAGKAELIVAKVRDGEPGSVPLTFNGPTTSFSEAE